MVKDIMNLAIDSLLIGIITVAAFTGLFISLIAYISSRSSRILLILGVFSLFAIKGMMLALSDLTDVLTSYNYPTYLLVIDLFVVGLLIISGLWE